MYPSSKAFNSTVINGHVVTMRERAVLNCTLFLHVYNHYNVYSAIVAYLKLIYSKCKYLVQQIIIIC